MYKHICPNVLNTMQEPNRSFYSYPIDENKTRELHEVVKLIVTDDYKLINL